MTKRYYVYIMTNQTNRALYTGVTNDLPRRVAQHRDGGAPRSFTSRYKVNKLVYIKEFGAIRDAIAREKQIKAGSRAKKSELIESENPGWQDLADALR